MSVCTRQWVFALLGPAGVLAFATPGQAQYMLGGFRGPMVPMYSPMYGSMYSPFSTRGFMPIPAYLFGGLPPLQPVRPVPGVNLFNPLMFNPFNPNYNPALSSATTYYYLTRSAYSGSSSYSSPYGGGYTTGGASSPAVQAWYNNYARAQQEAAAATPTGSGGARKAVNEQRAYEQSGAPGAPGARLHQESAAVTKALAETDPSTLATGDPLNVLLTATTAAQAAAQAKGGKGGKVDSAYLPPNLMSEVRFAGGPNATAVNFLRTAGHPSFPAAFDAGPAAALRPALERTLAAVAAPVLAGKAADPAKVAALAALAKQAREALDPQIKDMDFETAIAARRFVNQLDETATALKTPGTTGLIDPRWASEGTSVADLVKHMTRFKLRFGQAPKGGEEAYLALHRGLGSYLFALDKATPPKK